MSETPGKRQREKLCYWIEGYLGSASYQDALRLAHIARQVTRVQYKERKDDPTAELPPKISLDAGAVTRSHWRLQVIKLQKIIPELRNTPAQYVSSPVVYEGCDPDKPYRLLGGYDALADELKRRCHVDMHGPIEDELK